MRTVTERQLKPKWDRLPVTGETDADVRDADVI
jgi:hypothetical protein